MPTKHSQHSRYVIPGNLDPAGICCVSVPVPDDPQWRAQFLGALWRLCIQSHYERDDNQSGKIVAARWREVYSEVRDSMGICTPSDNIMRVTITANFRMQLLIEFTANGLDGIAPDRPDTFWDEDSGDAGDEIVQRENALCNACIDYVNTVADDLVLKIQAVSLFSTPFIIPIVMSIAPVAGAVFVGALSVIELLTIMAINDEEIRRRVACCMYENLKGVAITEASFNASMTGCGFPALSDEEIVRDMLEAGVNDTENYLAFVNVLGSHFASVGVAQIDCACGLWEHTFDFELENDGWTDRAEDDRAHGVYTPGVGWESENDEGQEHLYIQVTDFPARVVIKVEIFYTITGTAGLPIRSRGIQIRLADAVKDATQEDGYAVPAVESHVWEGSENIDEIEQWITDTKDPGGQHQVITKIVVTGEGSDPF